MNMHLIEETLRSLIAELDYDLHKSLECDEETGEDQYPEWADWFMRAYEENESDLL